MPSRIDGSPPFVLPPQHPRCRASFEPAPGGPHPLLPPSTFPTEDTLNRVHPFYVSDPVDPTFRALRSAMGEVASAEEGGEIVTFAFYLMAGLFSPFFNFFMEVLGKYQLRMAHLSTNVVLALAIFAHLCEAFVGVTPSVCRLFRIMRGGSDNPVGSVRFSSRNRHLYIEQSL